ncbi:hypothetical protein VPBG_00046 [Vibrio phage helene 12B3]|uniref:hypothetical protein n=1 Tax=Vibrio phage helene 12B3 TaxID=573173 RepID=UPI0002C0F00F|nr:hypothetical protein VPBG_00046 [Vibrio phage helene 12B3]AGG57818.1 hypothetical protein VPBG_00046 [Vibrio phage helene 12B3]
MSYVITPIEDFSPLRHTSLVAEAMGEVVGDLLSHLLVETNPYRIDLTTVGSVTTYTVDVDVEELESGTETSHTLTCTTLGTETVDEVYELIVTEFNDLDFPVNCTYEVAYNEDGEKYLTVVSKEGYRIISAPPVATNMTIDITTLVRASNGKPAAYGMGQDVLEQGYPKLIVTQLPITSVSENWKTGAVEKDIGDGLRFYPYNDSYIRMGYSVTCEAGEISEILRSNRPDSMQILRTFCSRIRDDNVRVGFFNKVQGTLNRDFTVTPIPSVSYTLFEDSSVVEFSLDLIVREVNYQGNIITKTTVVDATIEDRAGNQVQPVDFEVQAPSHP